MSLEQFNRFSPILAVIMCFLLEMVFIMVPFWPLTFVAAIIGGLFCVEMKWGALTGTIGVLLAWGMSYLFSMNNIVLQADQLGRLIIGSTGAGGIIVILIFLVGALFGFLGGSIGSGIRMLVIPEKTVIQEENQS
ncbi:MAG: hypothetical protein ACW964_03805 [Candidatus Hodarchaeales archaeon]|jgi:hypothetical protein